jgi:hypothetical protein
MAGGFGESVPVAFQWRRDDSPLGSSLPGTLPEWLEESKLAGAVQRPDTRPVDSPALIEAAQVFNRTQGFICSQYDRSLAGFQPLSQEILDWIDWTKGAVYSQAQGRIGRHFSDQKVEPAQEDSQALKHFAFHETLARSRFQYSSPLPVQH